MSCLRIDQTYLYLEGELSSEDNRSIKDHLSSCDKCQKAVEERKRLLEASQSLPVWETPKDFTPRVLVYIFPKRITFRDWIATAAVGLSSAALAFFAVYLISGQSFAELLVNLNSTSLNLFRNIIIVLAKAAKLISVGIQVIAKILSLLLSGLASFTTILSPELQIGLIVFIVAIAALLLFGAKRKFPAGEKA